MQARESNLTRCVDSRVDAYLIKRLDHRVTKSLGRNQLNATLAEWSKALRSGRSIFGCVGSNPTGCMKYFF